MRLFILLCFVLINFFAIGQVRPDSSDRSAHPRTFELNQEPNPEDAFYYAGLHLEKYTKQSYNGMLMVVAGSACAIIASDVYSENTRRIFMYAAFGLSVWGSVKTIVAIKHVGKAGKILKTIRLNENGVAVVIPIR